MVIRHLSFPACASALVLGFAGVAAAQTCSTTAYPYPLANGQVADATQVTADLTCAPVYGLANWSGAIGIGTASPAAKLDVNGWAIVRGNLSSQTASTGLYMWAQDNGSFGAIEAHNPANTVKYPLVLNAWGGNVGIGTSSPGSSLEVANGSITVDPTGNNYNEGLRLNAAPDGYATISLGGATGSVNGVVPWSISSEGGGTNFFDIRSNGATRFAIMPGGNVGIGTTSPTATLYVNGSAVLSQGYTQTSDARLKRDVRPLTGALALVAKMQGVRYNWKPVAERAVGRDLDLPLDEPQVGFLAQDLEKVLPEAVKAPKPGTTDTYSVEETKVVPVLVEAIKEQQAQAERQQAQMKAQQSEIAELRQEIAQLRAARK